MKSPLRGSRADGSTKAKVDLLIRRGWRPGLRISDVLQRRNDKRRQEGGGACHNGF
jgi:hypothetical protein